MILINSLSNKNHVLATKEIIVKLKYFENYIKANSTILFLHQAQNQLLVLRRSFCAGNTFGLHFRPDRKLYQRRTLRPRDRRALGNVLSARSDTQITPSIAALRSFFRRNSFVSVSLVNQKKEPFWRISAGSLYLRIRPRTLYYWIFPWTGLSTWLCFRFFYPGFNY